MIIIVITGQVATGKSTLTKMIKYQKYRVFDADECAHKLLCNKEVKEEIKKCFKSKENFLFDQNGKIDKRNLGAYVFGNTKRLEKLELILHPKIRKKQKLFLKNCSINRDKVVFLDIPLFNESLHRKTNDYIISMYVNKNIQKQRILRRKNMSYERMSFLLKKQEKLKKVFYSEFVTRINSGIGKNHVRKSFINFIKKVKQKKIKKIWPKQYNLNVK